MFCKKRRCFGWRLRFEGGKSSECLRAPPACLNPTQKHLELLKVAQGLRLHCLKVFQYRSKSPNVATNLLENPLTMPTKKLQIGYALLRSSMFRAQSNERKRSLCVESESQPNNCKWANETTNETRCLAQFVLIETRLWLNSIVTKTISWQFCAVIFVFRKVIPPNQGNPTQLCRTTIWSHVSCWSLLSQLVLSKSWNHVRELRNV